MSYTVLARRYRSQSFGQVVGQEPIAQTLTNAIATGRVHHAYLFTGTRGVGKTSMARIFARALNAPDTLEDCPKAPDHDEYPPLDVQQRMAEAIMRGEDMNVIEIDGASNRSVEDARQLIANASLSPTGNARYKVYIIDEVHMLTREAFNTLLKTMEEPPAHLRFILCTTEAEKVLPTIQSRCQRFDFRNVPTRLIAEHLKQVATAEGVEAEDAVIFQLARLGNGSIRDALSLLDRLLAAGQSPLGADVLEKMLGLPSQQLVSELVDAIAEGNAARTLQWTDSLLNSGISQEQMLQAAIEHLRDLMLVSACGADSPLVELDESMRKQATEQAARFDVEALVHMIALCENVQRLGRSSPTPRALVDALMVRLALSEKFADLAGLLGEQKTGAGARPTEKKKPDRAVEVTVKPQPPPPARRPAPAARPSRPATAAPAAAPIKRRPVSQDQRDRALHEPAVRQVIDLFDARLVDMRQSHSPSSPDDQNGKQETERT